VQEWVLTHGQSSFAVTDGPALLGTVTLKEIRATPRRRWGTTTAAEVMTPVDKVVTVPAGLAASSLLEQMDAWRLECVPVMEQDRVVGLVDRDSLTRLAKVRGEIGR